MESFLKTEILITLIYLVFMLGIALEVGFWKLCENTNYYGFSKLPQFLRKIKRETLSNFKRNKFLEFILSFFGVCLSLTLVYYLEVSVRSISLVSILLCAELIRVNKYEQLSLIAGSIVLSIFLFVNSTIPWALVFVQFILYLNTVKNIKIFAILNQVYSVFFFMILWFMKDNYIGILAALILFPIVLTVFTFLRSFLPNMKFHTNENFSWMLVVTAFLLEGVLL